MGVDVRKAVAVQAAGGDSALPGVLDFTGEAFSQFFGLKVQPGGQIPDFPLRKPPLDLQIPESVLEYLAGNDPVPHRIPPDPGCLQRDNLGKAVGNPLHHIGFKAVRVIVGHLFHDLLGAG
jgi:hypothetical protein